MGMFVSDGKNISDIRILIFLNLGRRRTPKLSKMTQFTPKMSQNSLKCNKTTLNEYVGLKLGMGNMFVIGKHIVTPEFQNFKM